MSQISDNGTYARTLHKLEIYSPSHVLIPATGHVNDSIGSTLQELILDKEDEVGYKVGQIDRRYYNEKMGIDYVQNLAFADDVEAIKISLEGSYYAVCCFGAVNIIHKIHASWDQ